MKIKNSIFDIVVNFICVFLFIGLAVYLIASWNNLPDQIPGHYNVSGEVTRWDGKSSLLFLPVTACFLFLVITIVERFPKIWNTGVRITEENMFRVYRIIKSMMSCVKLIFVAAFVAFSIIQSQAADLPTWLMIIFMVALFGAIIINIVRLVRAR